MALTAAEMWPGTAGKEDRTGGLPLRLRELPGERRGEESERVAVQDDGDLAARAKGGDRLAFARLYQRYAPAVHGVLLAAGPLQEARDLVQDVFLLALRAIDRLEDPHSVGPWLLAIARNRAKDAHKSRRAAVELSEGMEPAVIERAEIDEEQEAEAALRAVRDLPESYRETLILRLVEGLSGPEIAVRTGMTHGSVRVNLHRGMKLLRERLERGQRP